MYGGALLEPFDCNTNHTRAALERVPPFFFPQILLIMRIKASRET